MPKKPSKKKVEIISFFDFDQYPHREDFDTCPHCEKEFDHNEVWLEHRTAICTGIVQHKTDDGVVISECPACFEKSWVHFHLQACWSFSDEEQEAASKAYHSRHLAAIRELEGSLCPSCEKIKTLKVDSKTWRNCSAGMGRVEHKCESYKRAKGLKKTK